MIRLVIALLLLVFSGVADDENLSLPEVEESAPKILYLSYESVPQRVINGEIFPVVIKSLSTRPAFQNISFALQNANGVNFIDQNQSRTKEGKYFYDTFYFQANNETAVLPDFVASTADAYGNIYPAKTTLKGMPLNVITLNPKDDFSNILADSFEINKYKITSYDKNYNIVLFAATAIRSDLSKINIQGVTKQGIESLDNNFLNPKVTYYAIIKKDIETFTFSYFNLQEQKFKKISIPVIVDDDRVTTQSDLKPKDQQFSTIKIIITAVIFALLLLYIIWKRKYILVIFLILPTAYIIYLAKPLQVICVKEGSNVYLLPLRNGTIFEQLNSNKSLEVEGTTKGYKKIKLDNKIGWIRDEDICSN